MKTIRTFFIFFALFATYSIHAQVSISSDDSDPDPSAMLDIKSISKGVLFPRMTTQERDAIENPAESLMIFNTTTKCFEGYSQQESKWYTCGCLTEDVESDNFKHGEQSIDGRDNDSGVREEER